MKSWFVENRKSAILLKTSGYGYDLSLLFDGSRRPPGDGIPTKLGLIFASNRVMTAQHS